MNNSTIDPHGLCSHARVERVTDENNPRFYIESWECSDCKKRFSLLPEFNEAKLTIMEPYATLRDQFAMAAVAGNWDEHVANERFAAWAYEFADAMIEARKK